MLDPSLSQATELLATLTGYALYAPVVWALVEAIKQLLPENTSNKGILTSLSIVLAVAIVVIPELVHTEIIITAYRGVLLGATVTGFVAWKKSQS